MARTRDLKPGFFTNEELAKLPPLARLLFQGLWCHADREGRLEDRPARLKVQILPYDECDTEELLSKLAAAGFIRRYEADGKRLIHVVHFKDHQSPHPKEQPSTLPAPVERRAGERNCEPGISGTSRESPEQAGKEIPRGAQHPSYTPPPLSPPPISHSGPSQSASGARAHDPGAGGTGGVAGGRPSAREVQRWWSEIRAEIFPAYLPWDIPPDQRGVLDGWIAGLSDDAISDLKPAMRLALMNMRDQTKDWDRALLHEDASYGFGAFRSRLTALRERLRGRTVGHGQARASPAPAPDRCAFHQPATTANRKATQHDPACSECRHVAARERPRSETEPEPAFGGVR